MACKYYASPRWSGEILDCSMPMTFDTYDKCSYNCLYCFSYFQKIHSLNLRNEDRYDKSYTYIGQKANPVNVKKIEALFNGEIKNSQFNDYIDQKITFQWGGLADQFDENERKQGVSLQLLELFLKKKYPICFSTKATWWTKDERYLKLFKEAGSLWNVKFSIINLDEKKSKIMEKGVPSPKDRLEAMKVISKLNNKEVTLRLRPFIIGFSDANNEYLDLIKLAKENGASAVSTEFLCLEGRADERLIKRYDEMSSLVGFDLFEIYKKYSNTSGYYRLNYEVKKPYIQRMEALCKKLGLRFYVSDAHHKEKCANGSCCGLGSKWNYSRAQFTEALMIAKLNGKVHFSDISEGMEMFKKFRWRDAIGFNTGGTIKREMVNHWTMYDYIRSQWNTPNSMKSPYKYFSGILYPESKLDKNNDVVYVYKEK